jgi:hypothetical protein
MSRKLIQAYLDEIACEKPHIADVLQEVMEFLK